MPFHEQAREFLWFCAPALILGFVLRVLMTWQMPYGYMQFDSADFLSTTARFLSKGHFVIHSKRTFLVPLLYALPFIFKVPALIVIPIFQHLLGLGIVLITGLVARLWSQRWRWAIIPLTLFMAANPNLLWFEHALMSESVYLFCLFGLALAATLFTRSATETHFKLLLLALFFVAAARPEGRLMLGFGFFLLVLVDWGNWKILPRRLAWMIGITCITLPLTKTGQAGQLLYATVLPLAPDTSTVDPGFGETVRPLRDELRARQDGMMKLQGLEQSLTDMTGEYLEAKGVVDPDTNDFCEKLAIEACLHQPWALPGLARRKFLLSAKGPVSIGYDEPRLQEKLNIGFNRKNMLGVLAKGLTGRELSDTPAVEAFVKDHYHPMPWFAFLDESWQRLTVANDNDITSKAMQVPNLPAFFVLALLGAGVFLASPGPLQRFHIAWILSLSGLWFAVELTGVVNPRYRFAFEPFCLIYATLGFLAAGVNAAAAARHFFAPAERTQVTRMAQPTRARKTRDRTPATVPGSDCH